MERRPRVLLGVTGSVAAVKAPELALALAAFADVRLVVTEAGARFLALAEGYDPASWAAFMRHTPPFEVLRDSDEWASYRRVGSDAVLHIEVRAPQGGGERGRGGVTGGARLGAQRCKRARGCAIARRSRVER